MTKLPPLEVYFITQTHQSVPSLLYDLGEAQSTLSLTRHDAYIFRQSPYVNAQSGLSARRRNIFRYHTGYVPHIHIVYRNASRSFLTLHRVADSTRQLTEQNMLGCTPHSRL